MPGKHSDPAEWVDRYGDSLLGYARRRVASCELAEDLVQETLLAAYRHRAQFDGKSSVGTWLTAILRRKIADYYRQADRAPTLASQALDTAEAQFTNAGRWTASYAGWRENPKELAENAEFWQVFHRCLSALPPPLAQAFQTRELRMMSAEDASQTIGVTPQNLAVRLHRARLLLRECLDKKWFRGERGGAP
ncbi:MAG TPA: sigma-70 family RNA polymerase sigma factor [Lacipirellulaceae bacterium]|nr:sigma-70 family RNA polymerase sigma factor [Lacipirellulaceae bacterium]